MGSAATFLTGWAWATERAGALLAWEDDETWRARCGAMLGPEWAYQVAIYSTQLTLEALHQRHRRGCK